MNKRSTSSIAPRFILGALSAVIIIALYTSFNHLSGVLQELGRSSWDAHLLAFAVDAFVVASLVGVWKTPGWTPRVVLIIAILFTGSLNSYGGYLDHGITGALFALVPVFLVEAAYWFLRHLGNVSSHTAPAGEEITEPIRPTPQPLGELTNLDLKARMSELDEELKNRAQVYLGDNPKATVRDLARHFGRSQSWARNRMSMSTS